MSYHVKNMYDVDELGRFLVNELTDASSKPYHFIGFLGFPDVEL